MKNAELLVLLAVLAIAPASAHADPARAAAAPRIEAAAPRSSAPNVDELVRQALERAPSVAALRARLASAREQVAPAGALPDPMVGVMYQSMGPPWAPMAPMSMAQVEISQGLPYPGKRQARRTAAEAEAAVRAADIEELRAKLTAEVRTTYARLYALDQEQASLVAASEFAGLLTAAASARYASGLGEQEPLIKVELERSQLAERTADLRADRAGSVAAMARLLGDDTLALGTVERLPEPSVASQAQLERALAGAPELRTARAMIDAANRKIEAAQREGKSDFLLGLAGGATTTGDPIITLRVGVELPLWGGTKQDPLIRAAQNDAEASRQELRVAELRVREQLTRLVAQWVRDGEQIARYRDAIIPQSSRAFEAARGGYAAGRGDFLTVVADFRSWLDARVGLARREADQFMTWAEIESLLAAPPQRTP
jgi:outer membrane protein, heavy metal efflux system